MDVAKVDGFEKEELHTTYSCMRALTLQCVKLRDRLLTRNHQNQRVSNGTNGNCSVFYMIATVRSRSRGLAQGRVSSKL